MNFIEIVYNKLILKFGFMPFIITIFMVIIVMIITTILVFKELKGR